MDLRDELKEKPFRFSKESKDFLTEDPVLLVANPPPQTYSSLSEIPTDLLTSVQGTSFFATLKLLDEDVGNAGWFLNRLRIPGSPMNPDTQRVTLAILHGIHAYATSTSQQTISFTAPLPTRFRSTIAYFTTIKHKSDIIQHMDDIFTTMKRRYLHQNESNEELMIRDVLESLTNPTQFMKSSFFKTPKGSGPIPSTEQEWDTETVHDPYVTRINPYAIDIYPTISSVLGKR
jgi:hypothetical protein